MSLHKMVAGAEGKSDVINSTPTAGAVAVATNEIALWVGNTVGANQQQSVFALVVDMLERLREAGTPTSGISEYTMAKAVYTNDAPLKPTVLVTIDEGFITPAENDVWIYIGELFQPLPGTSVSTAIKRLLEWRMELIGKKSA